MDFGKIFKSVVVNVAGDAVFPWSLLVHALHGVPDFFYREFPVVCRGSRLLGLHSDLFMVVIVVPFVVLRGEVVQHYAGVSFVSAVSEPSGFRSVVICVLVHLFPAARLYTAFQGLAAVVMLQYSFQDLIFFLFMVAAYVALPSEYCVLRFSLSSSLFLVL